MSTQHVDDHAGDAERARTARAEAVERTAEDGVQGGAEAPQDESASIRVAADALEDGPATHADGSLRDASAAEDLWSAPGTTTQPASGVMGDATYGSGLGTGDDVAEPATEAPGRPAQGRAHLEAPPEARDPAAEAPGTLGIDDTDTALADEDTTG